MRANHTTSIYGVKAVDEAALINFGITEITEVNDCRAVE